MSSNTFHQFSLLPTEIRQQIWDACKPSTATIHINETEYEITHVSPLPACLTANKEARETALNWELKSFPIYTTEDWANVYLSPEDTILQLAITPSKSASLAITWTELHAILGDALPAAKHLHIVCSKPERLARLFMLPEAELVGVGQSCVERGLFGSEVISSDRTVRECLQGEVLVTTSTRTVEEIGLGQKEDIAVWRLVEEEISHAFGPEAKTFTTRAFTPVKVDDYAWTSVQALQNVAKTSTLPDRQAGQEEESEEVLEVEKSGEELTEEALERLGEEMARMHPEAVYEAGKEDPGGSVVPGYA